jgi:prepilin-type processing-associated H-X9-DG protein
MFPMCPFQPSGQSGAGGPVPVPIYQPKFTQFRKPSELALVFDGIEYHHSTNNGQEVINARHNGARDTNVLMCDGHAETLQRKTLPPVGIDPVTGVNYKNIMRSASQLNQYCPYPKWRGDQ